MISNRLVVAIGSYGDYVEGQGGERFYIDKIGAEIKTLAHVVNKAFPLYVMALGIEKTFVLSSAEQIVERGLLDGMSRKKYYKEIYQDVKAKVMMFAELHGKADVIEKQLTTGENK